MRTKRSHFRTKALALALATVMVAGIGAFAAPAAAGDAFGFGQAISETDLNDVRGMAAGTDAPETMVIGGGPVLASPANSIGGDSFQDANGIFTVVQNYGNNVVIQTSTSVTVNLVGP